MVSWVLMLVVLRAAVGRAGTSFNYDLANSTLAVVVDEHFHSESKKKVSLADSLRSYLGTATLQHLHHGGLNVEFYTLEDLNLRPDLTAVMTITSCRNTWLIYRQTEEEGLLHFAITDADCPRLPARTGMTVPLTEHGGDLPQMILDMKVERLVAWKSAVVLHDHSIASELLDRVLASLNMDTPDSLPSSVSSFSIPSEQADWKRRKRVENVLRSLPDNLGQRYLVMVAYEMVGVVMDVAKSLGMVHPLSQWLYILGDTTSSRDSLTTFTSLLSEGDHVAFASNYTTNQDSCQGGLLCHAYEMLQAFLVALDRSVQDELAMATQVSDEEWEAIRPSKEDRMALLLAHIKELLHSTGACGNCTAWRLRGGDTWGLSFDSGLSLLSGGGMGSAGHLKKAPATPLPPRVEATPAPAGNLMDSLKQRLRVLRSDRNSTRTGGARRRPPLRPDLDIWPEGLEDLEAGDGTSNDAVDEEALWPRPPQQAPRRTPRNARPPRASSWSSGSRESHPELDDDDRPFPSYRPKPRPSIRGRLVHAGWWRPREGFSLEDALFSHVAHGFKGRNLPIISYHNPPWQIIVSNGSGHVIEYKGLVFEIVKELAKNLNFTYTVIFPSHTDAGYTNDSQYYTSGAEGIDLNNAHSLNVSWDNLIKGVRDNKVFMGAGAFTVTSERKLVVNFTRAISEQRYHLLVVRPRELSRAMLFTSPFTATTWLCIALSVAAIGPVLHWIHCASPFYEHRGDIHRRGGLYSLTNCLWYAYGALLQQGGANLPDADSGRLVVGTWWLVVLVLVTTYCGNLVAALTFPRLEVSIVSAQDMVDHADTLTWGVWRSSPLVDHLKSSAEPRFAPVLERMELHDDEGEVFGRVQEGTHVFIDWEVNLLQIMKKAFNTNGRCDFSIVKVHDFIDEKVAMIMAQESPYLNVIDLEIRRMQQVGLLEKWLRDYLPKKDRCSVTSNLEANNHSVNLGDMQGSFFVLFFGFILGGILILTECGWRRWHSSKERKVIKPFVP